MTLNPRLLPDGSGLKTLSQNNNRDWYHANKSFYNDAKQEFEHVTEILLHEVSGFDRDIIGLVPKDCIFRIFRDVRFSANKDPYKTIVSYITSCVIIQANFNNH